MARPRRAEQPSDRAGRRRRIPRAVAAALLLLVAAPAHLVGLERAGEIVAAGGETGLLAPAAVWYDAVRDLLAVACPSTHRVLLLDRRGAVQKEIGKDAELRFPRAVAATRDGTLYVASPESESLAVFDRYFAAVGTEPRSVSLAAQGGARGVRPTSLFADESGRVYVADRGNRQILVLAEDGRLERTLRGVGEPADVWVDRAGAVYVAEPALGGIRVFDDRGKLLRVLGTSPTQFREPIRPRALAMDRSGRIWILEEGSRGIKALDTFGNLLFATSGEGLLAPIDLAVDQRDTLYVLEEGANRIALFRISGP